MMDNNEGDAIVRKGNEWEVVTLTESVYAASPGPNLHILHNSNSNITGDDNDDTTRAMFMSGHFGISPNTHENLSLEPNCKEKHDVGGKSDLKQGEKLHIKGLVSEEFLGVQQYDEKDKNSMSFYGSDFGDIVSSDLIEKEQSMYSTENFGSYNDEAVSSEPFESVDHAVSSDVPNTEEDKFNEPEDLPCEACWRKHAASLYGHAKNANPFWSLVVAAAVVGLVIIGHRWQREKPHVFHLKPQLVIEKEGSGWILGHMARLKDVTLSGQHISFMEVSCSTNL